jgi:hypothetical protein
MYIYAEAILLFLQFYVYLGYVCSYHSVLCCVYVK